MGYTSGWYTRHDLLRHLRYSANRQESWERSRGLIYSEHVLLASCYRGNAYSGNFWCVWQINFYHGNLRIALMEERYIVCNACSCYKKEWGYKDVTEDMGPLQFSCPVGYFDLVPIERYGGRQEWRDEVRRVAAMTNARRAATRKAREHWYAGSRKARKELKEARAALSVRNAG